eukprot:4704085-Alexandrium_andersonii.AAC.1
MALEVEPTAWWSKRNKRTRGEDDTALLDFTAACQSGERADLSDATHCWLAGHGVRTERLSQEEPKKIRADWLAAQCQR